MGGNAFDYVSRIEQKNIMPTLKQEVEPILNKLGIKNYKLLGSALKKDESSGDLDIGIEWNDVLKALNKSEISNGFSADLVKELFRNANLSHIPIKFFGAMATIAIPIIGQENEYVQTDLMFFNDLEYGELAKYAPEKNTSNYKSVIKNFLFYSIFPVLRFDEKYINDMLVEYKQYMVNDIGMFIKTANKINQKKPEKLLKNFKIINKKFITSNWNEIWNLTLGPKFKKSDWNSFETLYNFMNSTDFKHNDKLNEIIINFKDALDKNNYKYPKEIEGE